jgi:hypothetical protein
MSKRAQRESHGPRPGGSLVDAVFARTGLLGEARDWRVLHAWHRMAGPRLTRHTRAERVRGTTLLVRVASASWANELTYLRADLLARLRAQPEAAWIDELRFTIGPLDELPAWDDPAPTAAAAAPAQPTEALPPVDGGKVVAELLQVKDPELRAALAELFARARAMR